MNQTRTRLVPFLLSFALIPLLAGCIAILGGCFAIIVDGDSIDSNSTGWMGPGGSMSIAMSDHWPFELAVSETEVTLLVEGRTIVLPHTRGRAGVHYTDFDYEDREIHVELGDGLEARIDGIRLEVGDHEWKLRQPGTYRIDVTGGGFTYTGD